MRNRHLRGTAAIAGLTIAFALGGCAGGGAGAGGNPVTTENLVGSWEFVSGSGPSGEIKPLESPITAEFESGDSISTTVGCNNIFGPVKVEDEGALSMGPLAMTMMMCDEALMDLETNYANALGDVTEGSIADGKLVLTGDKVKLEYKSTN